MLRHILKKSLVLTFSLLVVVALTFFLMHTLPGDPFTEDVAIPQEILDSLYRYYHLDKPLFSQFFNYLKNLSVGDFGPSLKYQGRSANDIIKESFPVSFYLGMETLFFAIFVGITLGSFAAVHRGKIQDVLVMLLAVIGISVPSFILASLFQYLFAMEWNLLPVARWGSFAHTVLPALALAALPTAFIARLTRASMVEVLQQDYILMARAKGAGIFRILIKHALRNAILPILSYLGPLTAAILTGSFVIEKIFGIPGLGQWFVLSVMNRDYTLILSLTVFYSAFLMLCVYVIDILYCLVDPRIRSGNG